jgi:hypothetical protein
MAQCDLSLKLVCPVCSAKPHELCHMRIGFICFESHWERRELAMKVLAGDAGISPEDPLLARSWQAS